MIKIPETITPKNTPAPMPENNCSIIKNAKMLNIVNIPAFIKHSLVDFEFLRLSLIIATIMINDNIDKIIINVIRITLANNDAEEILNKK